MYIYPTSPHSIVLYYTEHPLYHTTSYISAFYNYVLHCGSMGEGWLADNPDFKPTMVFL